jgi:hypothetical protein
VPQPISLKRLSKVPNSRLLRLKTSHSLRRFLNIEHNSLEDELKSQDQRQQ